MLPAHILELIGKKISGDASPEELSVLQAWEAVHPEAMDLQALVTSLHPKETTFIQLESGSQLLEKGWSAISQEITVPDAPGIVPERGYAYFKWAIAASIMLLLGVGWYGFSRLNTPAKLVAKRESQVSTRQGSKTKIELPDGTKVWLNAGSKLTYADDYSVSNREVNLTGEAFFEVTTDAAHPLVVTTPAMKITVLGTRFNIKAYKDDLLSEATLLSGKISVAFAGNTGSPVILKPLEKLTIDQQGRSVTTSIAAVKSLKALPVQSADVVSPDSILTETAWISNHLQFKKEPFDDVMRKMERWYNVTIIVQNEDLHKEMLSGAFTTESIEQALKALQFTTTFHFTMQHDTVIIK